MPAPVTHPVSLSSMVGSKLSCTTLQFSEASLRVQSGVSSWTCMRCPALRPCCGPSSRGHAWRGCQQNTDTASLVRQPGTGNRAYGAGISAADTALFMQKALSPVRRRLIQHAQARVPDQRPRCRRHAVAIANILVLDGEAAMDGKRSSALMYVAEGLSGTWKGTQMRTGTSVKCLYVCSAPRRRSD